MLQTLFEGAIDAVLVVEDTGRCLDANPAACRLFALPHTELLQRSITDFIAAPWAERVAAGPTEGSAVVRAQDGRRVDVEYRARANCTPGRHLVVLRGLSDRQRAERERLASEEFLRRVIASSDHCIKVLDVDGRLLS